MYANVNKYEMRLPKGYVDLSSDEMEYDGGASVWASMAWGAMIGAVSGAIGGSVVPGAGTAVGAAAGAVVGAAFGAIDYYAGEAIQATGEAAYNYGVQVYNNAKKGDWWPLW
jgi:hypothetical protein